MAVTNAESLAGNPFGNISVFPNPTSGILEIVFDQTREQPVNIELYNLQGQHVSTLLDHKPVSPGQRLRFNLKDNRVGKGIYLLTISTPEKSRTRKVVVD